MGTPDYISPEQARAEKNIDFRTDLYSLGASLFHMVTGRPPFLADTAGKVLQMHVKTPLTPPESINPALSNECSALIQMMMAKDPGDRQACWDYVLDDIEAVLSGRAPGRKTLGLFGKAKKPGGSTSRADDVISLKGKSASVNTKSADNDNTGNTDVTLAMDSNAAMKMAAEDKSAPPPLTKAHAEQASPANRQPPKNKTIPPKIAACNKKSLNKLNLLILAAIILVIVLAIVISVVYHMKK